VEPNYQRRAPAPLPAPQDSRGFRRGLALLVLAVVLLIVVIAAIAIANSTSNTVIHYQRIVGQDAQSALQQVQSLINQYTK
jgi:Tfp pilus assembly protein PilE